MESSGICFGGIGEPLLKERVKPGTKCGWMRGASQPSVRRYKWCKMRKPTVQRYKWWKWRNSTKTMRRRRRGDNSQRASRKHFPAADGATSGFGSGGASCRRRCRRRLARPHAQFLESESEKERGELRPRPRPRPPLPQLARSLALRAFYSSVAVSLPELWKLRGEERRKGGALYRVLVRVIKTGREGAEEDNVTLPPSSPFRARKSDTRTTFAFVSLVLTK